MGIQPNEKNIRLEDLTCFAPESSFIQLLEVEKLMIYGSRCRKASSRKN